MSEYDYIIIGAGSAGCVLANKLGADRAVKILIVEAGGRDLDPMIHIPAGVHSVWKKPSLNWNYDSAPEPELGGRQLFTPRGKVVGGSSSINAMVYMRGHPRDYDGWAARPGLEAWDYDRCLPYFRAGENSDRGADAWRGAEGPLGVSKASFDNPIYDAFLEAGTQAGHGQTDDPNGYQPEGICRLDATRRNGRRSSAAVAHLRPALRRGNVTLVIRAMVERITLEGHRATGIRYRHKGQIKEVRAAREVILSGGALNSPQLLMLSGIGPRAHLEEHSIDCHHDLPGVGQNLQDHASVVVQYRCPVAFPIHRVDHPIRKGLAGARWAFLRDGIAASNIWEAGGFVRSSGTVDYADIQYQIGPVAFEYSGNKINLMQGFSIHVDYLRPRSRGAVTLRSSHPADAPHLAFNYYAHAHDLRDMVRGIEKLREIISQPAFEGLRGAELVPGAQAKTSEELTAAVRDASDTDFHPCGTCRMGAEDDCVVDPELRVHGIEGLRVVDASVMPRIASGNLNAPVQMIAARAADMIAGQAQLPPEHPDYAPGVR